MAMYQIRKAKPPGMSFMCKPLRHFVCDEPGCGMTPDCPMLHDEVWGTISHPRGLLCIKHTEALLGRELRITDLNVSTSNAFTFLLYDRLTKEKSDGPTTNGSP